MRIGLLIYGSLDTLSGGYLYDRKLVEFLRRNGDEVEIISLPWRNYLAHLTDNLSFRLPPRLDLLIQDELNHPSLICANRPPHPYPIISLIHHLRCSEKHPSWQNLFYRLIEQRYLHSVDGFIFNSKTTRNTVERLVGNNKPCIVAYPPTDRFGPALHPDFVVKRAMENGPLRILFLGNVIPRKGLHTLLEALTYLPPNSVHVNVAGSLKMDVKYANAMQKRAEKMPFTIKFHDSLNDQELKNQLLRAHVLVLPSTYEGFGIAYLEGMGFGLPAIGTTAGGASEIIVHAENGYLIPPGDAKKLAIFLLQLLADRTKLAEMGQNALQHFQRYPRWEETASRIQQFLRTF